jgi:hypothetical protein
MLNMTFEDVEQFVENNKSIIVGEKIASILLCGALLECCENRQQFNTIHDWEGPLIFKLSDNHHLDFDSCANYFAVGFAALPINEIIEIENIPLEKLKKYNDYLYNLTQFWDISYMFVDNIIGKPITDIKAVYDECEGPGVLLTLENVLEIKIINSYDWIHLFLT